MNNEINLEKEYVFYRKIFSWTDIIFIFPIIWIHLLFKNYFIPFLLPLIIYLFRYYRYILKISASGLETLNYKVKWSDLSQVRISQHRIKGTLYTKIEIEPSNNNLAYFKKEISINHINYDIVELEVLINEYFKKYR